MWQLKQLEKLHDVEPEVVDTVIGELLQKDAVLWEKVIIGAYIDGDINLGKAAELLKLHPVKVKEMFLSKGIPLNIGAGSKEEMAAEGVSAKGIREDYR